MCLESVIPSLDDFSQTELANLVDDLLQEENIKKDEGQEEVIDSSGNVNKNGGSGDNSDVDAQSAYALFDKLREKEDKELDDSVSSVKSSNSFRSVQTRKAKLTVLNQRAYSQIYVSE